MTDLTCPDSIPLIDCIRRGAALLDARKPGWRKFIKPDTLRMESLDSCILGQVFGGYTPGRHALDLWDEPAWAYGFDVVLTPEERWFVTEQLKTCRDQKYVALRSGWVEYLQETT